MAVQVAGPKIAPTLKDRPVIGSIPELRKDRLGFYERMARECGGIGIFHWGPFPIYMVNDPDLLRSILVENSDAFFKGYVINIAFGPIAGKGLFLNEGESHRKQRKLIAPVFQPRHLANYADTIVGDTDTQQAGWADGAVIDVEKEMSRLTMNIIGKLLFDVDVFNETDELGAAITDAFRYVDKVTLQVFPVPNSWPTPLNRWIHRRTAIVKRRVQAMIDERRANPKERIDLLSMLLNATDEDGSHMDDVQVRDEAVTLFVAGHETTAIALSWALYLLTAHPEIYAKLQQEVDTALIGQLPTYADLSRLPYTLQVIKETLRLYPPATGIARQALRDVSINGYPIRKNTLIILPMWATHRLPQYFPDPERFDPDRFTLENEKKLPRYAYWPFGAGPRVCIGNHLALMEAQLALATLVQCVTFALVPGQDVGVEISGTLHMTGCKMTVQHRH